MKLKKYKAEYLQRFLFLLNLYKKFGVSFREERNNAFKLAFVQTAFVQNPFQDNEQCFKSQSRGKCTPSF